MQEIYRQTQYSAPSMLVESIHRHSDRTLFICDDGASILYSAALELGRNQIVQDTKRRLVFCLCANVPAALVGYLGLLVAGAVPVMLNGSIPSSQLARLLEIYVPV